MDNCIFCKIVKKEFDSHIIFENDNFLVILDKFPSSLGHTLVVPKKHYENIFDMPKEIFSEGYEIVKDISYKLKNILGFEAMNVLQNNGEIAGQTIFHFHIHLIPRYKNDNVNISWNSNELSEKDFTDLLFKLKQ